MEAEARFAFISDKAEFAREDLLDVYGLCRVRGPYPPADVRPDGTPRSSAKRLALSLREPSSRFRSRPGCTAGAISYPFVLTRGFVPIVRS
jgi:hypothetical protein